MGKSRRGGWFWRKRREEPTASPLQEEAWDAAIELYRAENCRYFRVSDILPIYGCLCDYARGVPIDMRTRRLAERHLLVLTATAERVEADVRGPMPEDWEQAKAALGRVIDVFGRITGGQLPARP
jgi:hypothetical protein